MRTRTDVFLPTRLPVLHLHVAGRGWLARRVLAAVLIGAFAFVSPAAAQSRGELLYTTHCVSCHTTQMHWRKDKAARDWASLKLQVRRWQAASSLGWSESDILDVTRHLNESIYRFEAPADPVSSEAPGGGTLAPTSLVEPARGP